MTASWPTFERSPPSDPLIAALQRHKANPSFGVFSVCSAHEWVLETALLEAVAHDAPWVVIEATCNQVNHEGGYTGLTPEVYARKIGQLADRVRYPRERLILGGDHLGPNPWTGLPARVALTRAAAMVEGYVTAGFRKIHLDCSMRCQDDPPELDGVEIAARAAMLCEVAECAWRASGGPAPSYVIGTEVPSPGGAIGPRAALHATHPEDAAETLALHRQAFAARNVHDAWERVIALVVQPGIEFGHDYVVPYDAQIASPLSVRAAGPEAILYEAHSTDYQSRDALSQLVRDHFAILKVGPELTFALREAYWAAALALEERDGPHATKFRQKMLDLMHRLPAHWIQHHDQSDPGIDQALQYSYSDRIRYYWDHPEARAAVQELDEQIRACPPEGAAIRRYLPGLPAEWTMTSFTERPLKMLAQQRIAAVLHRYRSAVSGVSA